MVGDVVKDYTSKHQRRATKMIPNEAVRDHSHNAVKQTLEASCESNNPQPKLQHGNAVLAKIKKKRTKGCRPDWSDKLYTISAVVLGNAATFVAENAPCHCLRTCC